MSELYGLPDGWEWKKLVDKNVCELIMGQSPSSDTYNSDGFGMPFFQGKTEFGEMYPTVSKYCTAPNKIAQIGDILLSVRAPVGPTNIANIECCIGRGLGAIRPNINNTLTNYLLYFFRNFEIEISNKGKGSTFSAITKKELEDTDIPIPPLPEQQRIVSKLDLLFEKIDKSIALHQKNMDEADAFMGSVLNEVFGELEEKYGLTILSTVVKINSGIALPSIFKDKEITDGEYEFFKVAQMNNDKKVMKNADLNFTFLQSKEYKIKLFPKGSILIPKRGGAILTNKKRILERDASYDSNVMGLKANNKILSDEFLFLFLNSIDLANYIDTTTIPQINNKHIDMMNISIPPLSIQQKVGSYLDEISEKIGKIKQQQKEKMDSLKALKASILDSAFRGEL